MKVKVKVKTTHTTLTQPQPDQPAGCHFVVHIFNWLKGDIAISLFNNKERQLANRELKTCVEN
jgi:hypothetical protein